MKVPSEACGEVTVRDIVIGGEGISRAKGNYKWKERPLSAETHGK